MPEYRTLNDWLHELEGFGCRIARLPDAAMPWVQTAWELATETERFRCVELCEALATDAICANVDARALLKTIIERLRQAT